MRSAVRRSCLVAAVSLAATLAFGGLNVGVSDQCRSDDPALGFYLSALKSAGHEARIIPYGVDTNALREAVRKFDLVLFTGGEDVAPARYGEKPSPKLGRVNLKRDEYDFALFAACVAEHKPVFGICRGLQAMNVFFGGTLYQDIGADYPHPAGIPEDRHGGMKFMKGADNPPAHDLHIVPGSRLGRVIGTASMKVNSYHHQGVKTLAPGFRVAARSGDGFVEAIESTNYPAAAVQFHPEHTVHFHPETGFDVDRHLAILQKLMQVVKAEGVEAYRKSTENPGR